MADAHHTQAPAADASRARGGLLRIAGLTAAMAAVAALLIVASGRWDSAWFDAPWWIALLIAAGYALAERYVFHVEFRREAMFFSLSEVPTVFALAFLSPVVAVAAHVLASCVMLLVRARPVAYKVVFNLALHALEVALAFAVLDLVADPGRDGSGWFLVAAAIGAMVASFASATAVALAIATFEGGFFVRVADEFRTGVVVGPIAALTGAVSLAPALFGLEYAALSIVPVLAVWAVLSHLGRLTQRHGDLEALHGFAGAVGGSLVLDEILPVALERSLELLRGDRGLLVAFDAGGRVVARADAGAAIGPPLERRDDPRWAWALDRGDATWFDPDAADHPERDRPAAALAVPLRSDGTTVGLLLVAERSVTASFDPSDLRRAGSLGDQLAPAVGRALMHTAMTHAALHDPLTGDPNRTMFERALRSELEAGAQRHDVGAVLMLDLDEFKDVNDTLGHHVGDRALREFAVRIRAVLEPSDVLARFGGDEFAVLVRRPDVAAVLRFAEGLVAGSHAPFGLDGYDVVVPVSVGVAVVSEDDSEPGGILRRADIAMYVAKRRHTGVELYRDDIDRRTPERLALVADLRDVIDRGALTLHFQPKIDLATSTVVGAEALCRWEHPTRGWVPPDEFVRVAEETGLIRRLTDQVVSMAIATARRWQDAGIDLTIAVNLSTLDLLDDALSDRVARRLDEHGVCADRLLFEITESALMADSPRTMASVDRLHQLGTRLSLDDFGTGYSSLSYLRRLPVSELKIDRSFVANLVLDAHDEVIVRSTIELGHNLGLRVVAEGVENDRAIERLRLLGCDLGQGYGISRPLDAERFERWLATSPYHLRRPVDGAFPIHPA